MSGGGDLYGEEKSFKNDEIIKNSDKRERIERGWRKDVLYSN